MFKHSTFTSCNLCVTAIVVQHYARTFCTKKATVEENSHRHRAFQSHLLSQSAEKTSLTHISDVVCNSLDELVHDIVVVHYTS